MDYVKIPVNPDYDFIRINYKSKFLNIWRDISVREISLLFATENLNHERQVQLVWREGRPERCQH